MHYWRCYSPSYILKNTNNNKSENSKSSARTDEAGRRERKKFVHGEVGRQPEVWNIAAELISRELESWRKSVCDPYNYVAHDC